MPCTLIQAVVMLMLLLPPMLTLVEVMYLTCYVDQHLSFLSSKERRQFQ